jgi:hypothetical protein
MVILELKKNMFVQEDLEWRGKIRFVLLNILSVRMLKIS